MSLIGYTAWGDAIYAPTGPEILCNMCLKELNMPLIKYSYKNTCAKHIKDLPSGVANHVLGKVPGCGCINCPKNNIHKINLDEKYAPV